MNVYSTTVTRNEVNTAGRLGAGLYVDSGLLNFRGGVFAGNKRASEPRLSDCGGVMSSYGRNVFGAVRRWSVYDNNEDIGYLRDIRVGARTASRRTR